MDDQYTLPGIDEQPYRLHYRDYCDIWEVMAGNRSLKQFDTRAMAREGLEWLLEDWRATGEVRTRYPEAAPYARRRTSR